MGAHQVGHQILLQSQLLVQPGVFFPEFFINCIFRLAHPFEHRVADVLRSHLELAAHMILHQLPEKGIVRVRQQIVEADSGADEHLLHAGKRPQGTQEFKIIPVIRVQMGAGLREQTLSVFAHAAHKLILAGRRTEIGSRPSHIMNVAFKILILNQLLRLFQNGFMASHLHRAPLMEGQGAEAASAEASPVADQGKFDLTDRRDSALAFVGWMIGAHIGKGVYIVHFLHGQRLLRRILHHIHAAWIALHQHVSIDGIRVVVLNEKAVRISFLIRLHLFIGRQPHAAVYLVRLLRLINGSRHKGDILHIKTGSERIRDLHNGLFSHPIRNQIRLAVQKDGTAEGIAPVIIVGHPAQAGLDSAQNDRNVFVGAADQISIDHSRMIRPLSRFSSRRIRVLLPSFSGNIIVIDHGIHVPGRDEEGELRPSEHVDAPLVLPVRLGNDADAVAVRLQHAADDGMSKGGMIHIGVPDDIDKIRSFNPPLFHLFSCYRQESLRHSFFPFLSAVVPYCFERLKRHISSV